MLIPYHSTRTSMAISTPTRVFIVLFLIWLVAGAIMSFSMTPLMALGFKQRYKVDPYQVYQIVGACTAAMGVLVWVYFDYNEGAATPEVLTATPVYGPPLAFKPEMQESVSVPTPKLNASAPPFSTNAKSKNAARTARNPVAVATPDYYAMMVEGALEQMRLRGDTVKWTGK